MTLASSTYVVLDTSIVSLFIRERAQAEYYRAQIANRHLALSFQTVEELWHGAYHANWGEVRQDELAQQLGYYEIIWPNSRLVDICARLRAERKRAGRELGIADAWIAATALMLNCPLATADRDFINIPGLRLIQAA
ncbi:MAG: type II toxin-antitoxin system VapC family toxin [Dehalococcoidia bacterium]|nr:type II toxin-antitoxin system VapC family toxin [Dehalococcoidia bacterium]